MVGEDRRRDAVVLNFCQNLEFTDRYLVGKYLDEKQVAEAPGARKEVHWMPRDTINRDASEKKQKTPVKRNTHIRIGPGTVSPRGVHILLPDQFTELPRDFRGDGWFENDAREVLGGFFGYLYQQQGAQKALEIVARTDDQVLDKVERYARSGRLDDELNLKVLEAFERVKGVMDSDGDSSDSS